MIRRSLAIACALWAGAATAASPDEGAVLTLPAALKAAASAPAARTPALIDARARADRLHGPGLDMELMGTADAARVSAMARYFDVLLADFDATALTEHIAIAFGAFERARKQDPGGLDTLRAQARYHDLLARRNAARIDQRMTRAALAVAMGQPDRLASELSDPAFDDHDARVPTLEALERAMLERNPLLAGASARPDAGGLARLRTALRHALLAAVLELEWLKGAEGQRVRTAGQLADRVLDLERTRFENGEPNTFGTALATSVEARREERRVEYRIALVRARIEGLVGAALSTLAASK